MADETPAEREERLQHERVKESRSMPRTDSVGTFGKNVAAFFGEHKTLLIGATIGFGVVALVLAK